MSTFSFGTNFGQTGGKYLIKIIRDIKIKIALFEIWNVPNFNMKCFQIFNFGTNLGLAGGKYFIKVIFDIKIEISILEILDVPYFDNFWAFLILETVWA